MADNKHVLHNMRQEYNQGELSEEAVAGGPIEQFAKWFAEAEDAGFKDPNAMSVSTVGEGGRPSSRMVLLKEFDKRGFVFYTNYESRKGQEIGEGAPGAILFYWDKLERQVRIEGRFEKTSREESEEYFRSRPYDSRIGARVSKQSRELESRGKMVREIAIEVAKHPISPPLPDEWGGYRLVPDYFEFWQGRKSRLHDRIVFEKAAGEWKQKRLYP